MAAGAEVNTADDWRNSHGAPDPTAEAAIRRADAERLREAQAMGARWCPLRGEGCAMRQCAWWVPGPGCAARALGMWAARQRK